MRTTLMVCAMGAVVGIGAGMAAGCTACDAGVCSDVLWVYFREPGGGALHDGEYRIDVTIDGELDTATCTVGDGGHELHCTGLTLVLSAPLYDSEDNPHTVLELFYEDDPPTELDVTIVHDGATLFDDTIEPDYDIVDAKCHGDCVHSMNKLTFAR